MDVVFWIQFKSKFTCTSVRGGIGKSSCRQSDPGVRSVIDRVESLEEGHAEDELSSKSTLSAARANVTNTQINVIDSSNSTVEITRQDLSVRS